MPPKDRPETLQGVTHRIKCGCGTLYVTVNKDGDTPFEIFVRLGKAGGCAATQVEAIARLSSLALRCGASIEQIKRQLKLLKCPTPIWDDGKQVFSCADAVAKVLEKYKEEK